MTEYECDKTELNTTDLVIGDVQLVRYWLKLCNPQVV